MARSIVELESEPIRIVCAPSVDAKGRKKVGKFDVRLFGESEILCVSSQPLLDACRKLLLLGISPNVKIDLVHSAAPNDVAISGVIGSAGKLDVMGTRFIHRRSQ